MVSVGYQRGADAEHELLGLRARHAARDGRNEQYANLNSYESWLYKGALASFGSWQLLQGNSLFGGPPGPRWFQFTDYPRATLLSNGLVLAVGMITGASPLEHHAN